MNVLDQMAAAAYDAELAATNGRLAGLAGVQERMQDAITRAQYRTIRRDLLGEAIAGAVQREDRRRLARGASSQLSLFDPDGLEGVWPLGDGGRVEKKVANGIDHGNKYALEMQNAAQVNGALAASGREYAACQRYYAVQPTLLVEQALAMWRADNPGRDRP